MPDFVKENELVKSEVGEQPRQGKADPEEGLAGENEERKTLRDQLKESREQKYKEYQENLESRNSSYKLDEKSARFYDQLKTKAKEDEMKAKDEEKEQLSRYRALKRNQDQQKHQPPLAKPILTPENTKISFKKRKVKSPTIESAEPNNNNKDSIQISNLLNGYSSSENESS
ncbi:hypothetical protein HYPBUDRAFT_152491 [Hyphopichia burtonii NRRL Y-1933]|uniref:FAM192A/Fyv6 N-terminal domain-containing protein n=1 Tax=Hyphopichia burtonii NRRL Y-1933 TaxID=984485 RepID=A0A1E4RK20_9ASCO|nr:hypothetical protein HYPBUDRAFT_152491 [Hyphopichia burtonii NRRL Y-1933]ODV67632.1 hypothetical protein HYPBUDRAFT_152491 [Hyphopichia burtonii NRRL Y-1933]